MAVIKKNLRTAFADSQAVYYSQCVMCILLYYISFHYVVITCGLLPLQIGVEPREGTWLTSRLKKRPAHHHVTGVAMTTASAQHVVARVGKSPSGEFYDYDYDHYTYDQCTCVAYRCHYAAVLDHRPHYAFGPSLCPSRTDF